MRMGNSDRLAEKIQKKIERWFIDHGDELVICIKEFCQGNRASLTPLMALVGNLGSDVFADGKDLNDDLLNELENKIFDLIGDFSSTPGGNALLESINDNIVERLTAIFAESKRNWNLNYYKITDSVESVETRDRSVLDQEILMLDHGDASSDPIPGDPGIQARDIIDSLVIFAKEKFIGKKNRKIAVNWLENPERLSDISWLASTVGSSKGSTKVTLTRIKKSLAKHYSLKRIGDKFVLEHAVVPVRRDGVSDDS